MPLALLYVFDGGINMFSGFNLELDANTLAEVCDRDLEKYKKIGVEHLKTEINRFNNEMEHLVNHQTISGSQLQEYCFPNVDADIFILTFRLKGLDQIVICVINFALIICLWYLDAFFLKAETLYRWKYNWVIANRLETDEYIYDLDPHNSNTWLVSSNDNTQITPLKEPSIFKKNDNHIIGFDLWNNSACSFGCFGSKCF